MDLKEIESFAKSELIDNISVKQYSEYFGPFYEERPAVFQIVPGHKRLILLLRDYFLKATKSYTDCSTMTDVEYVAPTSNKNKIRNTQNRAQNDHAGLENNTTSLSSEDIHAITSFENSTENTNASFSSSLGSPLSSPLGSPTNITSSAIFSLSNVNLTQHNSDIYRTLKKWAKSKVSMQGWSKLKFDDIKIQTYINSDDDLYCKVTCFCGQTYKLCQASRKPTCKPR